MDIQLLLRLDRMLPPRTLTLQADIAGAKRLMDARLIEASHGVWLTSSGLHREEIVVVAITAEGYLLVAQEKARPHQRQPG